MSIPYPNTAKLDTKVARGRFAPSPTGVLHLGSLVAAVASYLIAKQAGGQWIVRIEDLDPPREVEGSAKQILKSLEDFGFEWDENVYFQSQRTQHYQQILEELIESQFVYRCSCSRKMVDSRNSGVYDGYCRDRNILKKMDVAYRIKFLDGHEEFFDHILGHCRFDKSEDKQDFVVKRRDGFFAYQLAVVADDISQGINQIVRGSDILDSTPRQNFIYQCIGNKQPDYYHLPLVLDENGSKLSKRFNSTKIKAGEASKWLLMALSHLGQSVDSEMLTGTPKEILQHFVGCWETDKVVTAKSDNLKWKEIHGY